MMAACHAADPGSIPGRRKFFEDFFETERPTFQNFNIFRIIKKRLDQPKTWQSLPTCSAEFE